MAKVHVFDHPLIQHKLSFIRDKKTGSKDFRQLTNEVGSLMAYEITRDLPLEDVVVETPIQKTTCKRLAGKKVVFVPILRAGLGMFIHCSRSDVSNWWISDCCYRFIKTKRC